MVHFVLPLVSRDDITTAVHGREHIGRGSTEAGMAKTLWKRYPHRKAVTGAVLIAASLLTAVQAGDSPSSSHGKTRPLSNQQLQEIWLPSLAIRRIGVVKLRRRS
jgi:hypothetical protein